MTKTKKKKQVAKAQLEGQKRRYCGKVKGQGVRARRTTPSTRQEATAVQGHNADRNEEIVFKAAVYVSKTPAVWLDHPIRVGAAQQVHAHRVSTWKSGREHSSFELVTTQRLPSFVLQSDEDQGDAPFRIASVTHTSASPAQIAVWIEHTHGLQGGLTRDRTSWPWLVSRHLASSDAAGTEKQITDIQTISSVVGSIERQLLTAEFNTVFLAGRAQHAVLRHALMIQRDTEHVTRQNRGEVLGDAICEVLLVADRVSSFLRDPSLGQNSWHKRKKDIPADLSNRTMMSSSVSKGAHQYIRYTHTGPVLVHPQITTGQKAIADTVERIIAAVYESTIRRITSDGWLRGNFGAVREAAHALGLHIDTASVDKLQAANLRRIRKSLGSRHSTAPKTRAVQKWKERVRAKLGYQFSDNAWLELAGALFISYGAHTPVQAALESLGSALTKLLAVLYAYFKGADSALGATPKDIDATRVAWIKRGNIEELYSLKIGHPKISRNGDSQRSLSRSSFLWLLALAYLDSGGDLSRGPADIMANVLANQGRRIEEAIDLEGPARAPREATYSPDSDIEALPTPVKGAFEVIDLDERSDDNGEASDDFDLPASAEAGEE